LTKKVRQMMYRLTNCDSYPDLMSLFQNKHKTCFVLVLCVLLVGTTACGEIGKAETSLSTPQAKVSNAAAAADWPTYHRDKARSGYVKDMPDPQRLTVAWNTRLDGAVYAQPLAINGHILAATENNTIYSLEPLTGKVEWQTHIDAPVPRSKLPCGNIDPLGI